MDHTEKQPAQNVNIASSSQAFLLEGDTEVAETPKTTEEIPLQVSVAQGLLTVRARQQPHSASCCIKSPNPSASPLNYDTNSPDVIDLNVAAATPLQWMRTLPVTTQLYYRRNLQNTLDQPLRLLLEKPAQRKFIREPLPTVRKK